MNRTLFSCGIKRTVTTRKGQEFDVSATFPRSVKLLRKPVKCDICNESFTAKKYLKLTYALSTAQTRSQKTKSEITRTKLSTESCIRMRKLQPLAVVSKPSSLQCKESLQLSTKKTKDEDRVEGNPTPLHSSWKP
ncbi:unnamed protein product [Porites lobata]|uniref:Uncharacterized protein n=1 Tax=Porites lobata TaxID=104759 RepID=A0ABN8PY93_9CNID|nr:unnamed protein product [Porites lobata]